MISWAEGTVTEIAERRPGACEVIITTDDRRRLRGLAYPDLVGEPRSGDRVLINIGALEHGLGTGGFALVVAVLDADGHLARQPAAPRGHLVKARYTPSQVMIAGVDEQGSAHHDQLAEADDLAGLPVIVADLHSALPPILAAIRQDEDSGRRRRVAYLMTDDAALPIALSRTVAGLRESGWLAATITCGQAFGGDFEAVNVHSGLLAARVAAEADLVIATQGPGNLGTGTRWGFSGTGAGEVINAAAVLGGRPVGALRISGADRRPRHRGVSHHSLTTYGRVALRSADLAVPDFSGAGTLTGVGDPAALAGLDHAVGSAVTALAGRHRLHRIDLAGLDRALQDCPVPLSTMGRGLAEDPGYFLAGAAAGRLALALPGSEASGRSTDGPISARDELE